ncbi:MAG: InlB B-repeat-containing protein [Planctomycetota bacterium]|jgi:hypothetical protein
MFVPAYCKTPSVTLLLEQTPSTGGEITPVAGVYYYAPGAEVTLTAVPKPGYQFVHWLGEVSDPASKSTVVYLNKPKVIIAVFEQTEYGILGEGESLAAGGGAGGGPVPTAVDFSRPAGLSSGGGGKPQPQKLVFMESGDAAPEVPEPATGVLLVLGSLFAFSRRGVKKLD